MTWVENLRGSLGLRGSIKFWRGSDILRVFEPLRGFEILTCVQKVCMGLKFYVFKRTCMNMNFFYYFL